jgi:hypothetical protein
MSNITNMVPTKLDIICTRVALFWSDGLSLESFNKLIVFFFEFDTLFSIPLDLCYKILADDDFPQKIGQELPQYAVLAGKALTGKALAAKAKLACECAREVNPLKDTDKV